MTEDVVVREFLGTPIEGSRTSSWQPRAYNPRPIEDLKPYLEEAWNKGIKAITWKQYTPHWMDGDVCEFSVHEIAVTSNEEVAEQWEDFRFYEDREIEVTEQQYLDNHHERYYSGYSKVEEDGKPTKFIRRVDEVYEYELSCYGDHPDGVDTEALDLPMQKLEFEDALRTAFGDHTQVVLTPTRVLQEEYSHD